MTWPLLHLLPSSLKRMWRWREKRSEDRASAYLSGLALGAHLYASGCERPDTNPSAFGQGVGRGWDEARREQHERYEDRLLAWAESGVVRLERYANEHGRAR